MHVIVSLQSSYVTKPTLFKGLFIKGTTERMSMGTTASRYCCNNAILSSCSHTGNYFSKVDSCNMPRVSCMWSYQDKIDLTVCRNDFCSSCSSCSHTGNYFSKVDSCNMPRVSCMWSYQDKIDLTVCRNDFRI